MDKTSKVMPTWMQIKNDKPKPFENLKSSEYRSFLTVYMFLLKLNLIMLLGKRLCYTG